MEEQIYSALVSFLNADYVAAHPYTPIVYDNSPFDWNSPPRNFVEFEIDFMDADQVGASAKPKTRLSGFIRICCYARAGTGSKASLALLDWFSNKLAYQTVGSCHIQAAQPDGNHSRAGFDTRHMKLYFYSDPY
jgi:hypothetical protein